MAAVHPLERDLTTLWEFCRRAKTGIGGGPTTNSEQQIFAYGLVAYAIELATAVGWLTTVKNGPGAMTMMTTLEATHMTIEQVINVMNANDLRSVLRAPKGKIKVDSTNWKNLMAKQFRDAVDSPLRTDCRHGGSIHWGWLKESDEGGRTWEHSVSNQRKAVMGANAALVLIVNLFGDAAEEDQEWNYQQITGNVWRDEHLTWDRSIREVPWNGPFRKIQRQAPPEGMSQVSEAIDEYEKAAELVFDIEWGERRPQDTEVPWGEYRLYAMNTAIALGESVYNLVHAGMYGAAFALARASWESTANAHYVWNEVPSPKVLQFLQQDDNDRPIPLPKNQAGWKRSIAKTWARLKGTRATVLAELAKGERVQGQRWAPKVGNQEHCPYREEELTNLVRFAAMNLMFLKASYFHFEQVESREMFERLMDRWEPEWPRYQVSGVA